MSTNNRNIDRQDVGYSHAIDVTVQVIMMIYYYKTQKKK